MLPCCIQAHDFTLSIRKDRVTQQDKIIPAGFHHMLHPVWWFYGIKLFSVQCCITASTYYTGDLSCFYFESSVLANHRSQRFPVFRFLSADWPAAVVDGPGFTSWTQVEVLVLLWRVAVTVCSKQPEIRARQQCHIRVRASENMSTLAKREKIVSRCVTEASH